MNTLIVLSAIAGSGKSTWARSYQASHNNVHIVSSDELRKELGGSYTNFDHEEEVWFRYLNDANELAKKEKDVTVILDATNMSNRKRAYYATETHGFDKKILVVIRHPLERVLYQNRNRTKEKIVPEDVVKDMHEKFWEEPDEETLKLFNECIRIEN